MVGRTYMKTQSSSEDEWIIKKWIVPSEPRVIYIKPEDVPVCLVKKDIGWKPPEDCHTKYGLLDDPLDAKFLYEYLKDIKNDGQTRNI